MAFEKGKRVGRGPHLHGRSRPCAAPGFGRNFGCDVAVDEQRIERVTDGRPLRAGIDDDIKPPLLLGADIDVVMADADTPGDYRNRALLATKAVQAVARREG